jgi:hypothetical protein
VTKTQIICAFFDVLASGLVVTTGIGVLKQKKHKNMFSTGAWQWLVNLKLF